MARVFVGTNLSKWATSPQENIIIHEACSAEIKNRWHVPAFRLKAWDGCLRMYNPRAKTLPTGLVPDAIKALKEAGFETQVFDDESIEIGERPDGEIYFELDPNHQLRALEAMCENKRGIIKAATNAGKTKIAEAWCVLNDAKVLYIVPTIELLNQTIKSFRKDTNLDIGCIRAGEEWVIGRDVTVCLASSVGKRKNKADGRIVNEDVVLRFKEIAQQFNAVIVDECHHMVALGWRWILKVCKNAHYRYGLSGTPWDHNDKAAELRVKSLIGPLIAEVSNKELIDRGWSAKPTIFMVQLDSWQETKKKVEYDEAYFQGIICNDLRNNIIGKLCEQFASSDQTCLVISTSLDQCDILSGILKMKRVPHRVLIGDSHHEERKQDLQDFKDRQFPVLISTVLSEGVDITSLNAIVLASGGKSSKKLLQRVGRGLRKKQDSENVVAIYDFNDQGEEHLKSHSNQRKRIYLKEGFEVREHTVRF